MMPPLNDLEQRLKALIEVDLLRLIPGRKFEDRVIQQLAAALRDNVAPDSLAPNVFTLVVNPAALGGWQQDATLLDKLSGVIRDAGEQVGLTFNAAPVLSISVDPALPVDGLRVMASHKMGEVVDTQNMPVEDEAQSRGPIPHNAFLIIGGVRVFQLSQSPVNIGRRADNQLVLDDPRVSRYHAQIRAVSGRFVIFDLNSTGGTYVNGQRINNTILYPGDVISLAGLPIIFGQDNPPIQASKGNTGPLAFGPKSPSAPPSVEDRPTVRINRNDSEIPTSTQ